MLKRETVVVLGAGASKEVGLPLGDGLKEQIAGLVRKDQDPYGMVLHDPDIRRAVTLHISDDKGTHTDPAIF